MIISLLEKHGRDPKVLDVLCSLCVGNGVAVRSSQNNICDFLLPGKNLLLQTMLVDQVARCDRKFNWEYLLFVRIPHEFKGAGITSLELALTLISCQKSEQF